MDESRLAEFAYAMIILVLIAQLVSAVAHSPSLASATSYASAIAALLALGFFCLDHYNLVYGWTVRPEPGLFAMATFLQTLDISRALLLQTPTCGPYVLMLFSMFEDLAIWLTMLAAVVLGFAAAVFANKVVEGGVGGATVCAQSHSFFGYVYTMFEITMGGDSQIDCTRMAGDYVSLGLMLLYYLVAMILLMNMLIGMPRRLR